VTLLRIRSPWILGFFSDGGAVVYNPFSGELHAINSTLSEILGRLSSGSVDPETALINPVSMDLSCEIDSIDHQELAEILDYLKNRLGILESVTN